MEVNKHPYATEVYARSLAHAGTAFAVPEWGCHVLLRPLGDSAGFDAMGTYPLAILDPDADLRAGLDRLKDHGVVSVALVVNDIDRPPLATLHANFDLVRQFKTHFLRRLSAPFSYDRYHRRKLRSSLRSVEVSCFDLAHHADDWAALYAELGRRHELEGIHEFTDAHTRALQRLDGVTAIGAFMEGRLVCAHLWVSDARTAHSHLTASSSEGYAAGAAYAVNDASVSHFAALELLNFGGGAGTVDRMDDGLARFKRGFCNDVAPAYLCGAVLDHDRYSELVSKKGATSDPLFFPAYRAPAI